MSKDISECAAKHGRMLLLVAAAVSIGVIGAYVAYSYSSTERAMMAKVGRTAAGAGLSDMFSWAKSNK